MWKAVLVVVCLALGVFANPPQQSELGAKALQFFERIEDTTFDGYLKRVRLPKVTVEFKAQVIARLIETETIRPSAQQQVRLAALAPIFKYHEREAVLEIKVINAREAFVSFQGRSVLLISENILRLLSIEELQAVVAHELGHEYFWGELMEARQQKNHERMRELELLCDGIAVIALHRQGIDPVNLISALTVMRMFNARVVAVDSRPYPQDKERFTFIRAMSELMKTRETSGRMIARY